MSELIQESKYITVQEFMPLWTQYMEIHNDTKQHQFKIDEDLYLYCGDRCLVGEASGFNSNYGEDCITCGHLATGLEHIKGVTYNIAIENLKNFYIFKEGLYDHFMEAHPEKLLRK